MQIRLATSKDKLVWDAYVDSHSTATPYCRFAWKKSVEQAYGHEACYLLATEEEKIKGIFPLFKFSIPLCGSSLISLPYCDVGDVLADNDETRQALLAKALAIVKTSNSKEFHLRSCTADILADTFGDFQVRLQKDKVRLLMTLPGSSGELWSGFKSKLRSQVKKAEKNGLTFRWGNLDDLNMFYDVFSRNMHALGSPVHSKVWIENILVNYGENARMGLVFKEKQPVGCGIILCTKEMVSIPWASTLREYNRLSPNMMLYWHFLKYSADSGKKVFDFGRSTLNEGTYRFKKQWGAEPEPLYWYWANVPMEKETRQGMKKNNLREKLAYFWSKMPLSVVNTLGPRVRKYISL